MKQYEIGIYTKKNSRFIPNRFIDGYIVTAENKKQAGEFAYELYREGTTAPLSRECLRIEVEVFNG